MRVACPAALQQEADELFLLAIRQKVSVGSSSSLTVTTTMHSLLRGSCLSLCTLALLTSSFAHMMLSVPPPIHSEYDPYANYTDIDYTYTSPLADDGSNFPCKGYQQFVEPAVETYTVGQSYFVNITGSATHLGGTCQLSLSYDNGASFKVIKSMIGGCPLKPIYDFIIPLYAPSASSALFAWTWVNHEGNREYYMNCAWVNIVGGPQASSQEWSQLPDIFVAQLPGVNSCQVPEGEDYVPPQPGPEVEYSGRLNSSSPAFDGNCQEPNNVVYNGPVTVTMDAPGASAVANADVQDQTSGMVMAQDASTTASSPTGTPAYVTVYVDDLCSSLPPITTTITASTVTIPYESSMVPPASPPPAAASSAIPTPPYAGANTDIYEPCVPGTFLCTDINDFLTCDQPTTSDDSASESSGWSWQDSRAVADGMECLPFLSPLSSATVNYGQMPGAPQGYFRDDRYVRARPNGSCNVDGAVQCNGSNDFWICDQGGWVEMGSTAAGTVCEDGAIVADS